MNEKILKYTDIIEKMKKERKIGNLIFYIFLFCSDTMLWVGIGVLIAFLLGLYFYIKRNNKFLKKISEVENYSKEIDEYCIEIRNDLYVTNNYTIAFFYRSVNEKVEFN